MYCLYKKISNAGEGPSSLGQFQECDRKLNIAALNEKVETVGCNNSTLNSVCISMECGMGGSKPYLMVSSHSNPLRWFCRKKENKIQF